MGRRKQKLDYLTVLTYVVFELFPKPWPDLLNSYER